MRAMNTQLRRFRAFLIALLAFDLVPLAVSRDWRSLALCCLLLAVSAVLLIDNLLEIRRVENP